MMNIVQACGVVAKHKGSSLLVATMLSMFIFYDGLTQFD